MGFLEEHFITPITQGIGYNIYNTVTYAVLVLIVLYLTGFVFKKMKIKADNELFKNIALFVVLGGFLRALQDLHFFNSLGNFQYLFVTPLIHILIYSLVLSILIIESKCKIKILRKTGYALVFLSAIPIALSIKSLSGLIITLLITGVSFALVFLILKKIKSNILKGVNWLPFLGQTLDACSTVTAIMIIGGFREQHVLPNLIFSHVPFYWFIPLKIVIIILALHIIDKDVENKNWNFLLKLALLALGLGPGIRNTLTMII